MDGAGIGADEGAKRVIGLGRIAGMISVRPWRAIGPCCRMARAVDRRLPPDGVTW
jgi:hypothetical protein